MLSAPLQSALLFALNTLFNVYISIVLFRFLLQLTRADFYNPISQFIVKATNPLILPLRKVIPTVRGIELAPLVLALLLQALSITLELLIRGFNMPLSVSSMGGLFIWSFGEVTDITLVILLFAMIIQIVASWVQPGQYNPATVVLSQITAPIVNPVRRILPTAGALDFSPMVVIFVILVIRKIVPVYIINFGQNFL